LLPLLVVKRDGTSHKRRYSILRNVYNGSQWSPKLFGYHVLQNLLSVSQSQKKVMFGTRVLFNDCVKVFNGSSLTAAFSHSTARVSSHYKGSSHYFTIAWPHI